MFDLEKLHKLIAQNCFQLYFYPLYDNASPKAIENEIVVKYNDSMTTMEYKDFSVELESKELIGILDIWVLNQVCSLQKHMAETHGEMVSAIINVSAWTLSNPYYVYDIALILKKYELPQGMIQIAVISAVPYKVTYGLQKGLLFLQLQGVKVIYPWAQGEP